MHRVIFGEGSLSAFNTGTSSDPSKSVQVECTRKYSRNVVLCVSIKKRTVQLLCFPESSLDKGASAAAACACACVWRCKLFNSSMLVLRCLLPVACTPNVRDRTAHTARPKPRRRPCSLSTPTPLHTHQHSFGWKCSKFCYAARKQTPDLAQ